MAAVSISGTKLPKLKIKKGDLVEVITGASQKNGGDRGKQGKVIAVFLVITAPPVPAR